MKRSLKKGLGIATASLVGLTGLVGAMHMPFARSFLMRVGGCPIVRATPDQLQQAQSAAAARNAAMASSVAPARPALGFTLEKTTPAEVHAWIASKGIKCSDDLGGIVIVCLDTPAAAIGQTGPNLAELQFNFRSDPQVLRTVSTFRNHMSREDTLAIMQARDAELTHELGTPPVVHGQPDLRSDASAVYLLSYNFKDYLANEQAAELGSGFTLAEHYVSQVAKTN